jgi:hypothetical protein
MDTSKKLSDLFAALNADAEMKELAFKSGFELVNVPLDQMGAFMKERAKVYSEVPWQRGLTGLQK